MSKTQAKSFTFRLPLDVHEVLMAKVGERDRSRFVVQALKQALGLTPEDFSSNESGLDLAVRVNELSYRLELMKTEQDKELQLMKAEQDKVLQRLANLENDSRTPDSPEILEVLKIQPKAVIQSQTESKTSNETEELGQKAIEYATQSKTKSETEYPTIENLLLLEESDNLIEDAEKIDSAKLLAILRREQPQEDWNTHKLRPYREGKKKKAWHEIKNCKFKYAEEIRQAVRPEHFWWVIYSTSNES